MTAADHAARLRAFADTWFDERGADAVVADLRAALDELEQLRAERTPRKVICPVCQRPTKLTATGLIRYHGPHNRPCKGSSILPEVEADDAPQQPERDGAMCAFPGCVHPDHQPERDREA